MHDMKVVREIERVWDKLASVERDLIRELGASIFQSDSLARFPNLAVTGRGLVNKVTGDTATLDDCRQVCVFRFGRVGMFSGEARPDLIILAMLYLVNQMGFR